MSFRQELLDHCHKELMILVRNIEGMTISTAVDTLLRSLERTKGGAKPEDSAVYKVAAFFDQHRPGGFQGIGSRKRMFDLLEKSGVSTQTARNVVNRYEWRLPNHLKTVRRDLGRTVIDKPTIKPEPTPTPVIEIGDSIESITIKAGGVEITVQIRRPNEGAN